MQANKFCKDKVWLRQKYVTEGLSGNQIAELAGCHFQTVYDWLHKHGIEVQRPGPRIDVQEELYRDENWLYVQYWELGKTATEIGVEFGYNEATVRGWLVKTGVGTRPRGFRTEYTLSGEEPFWDNEEWLMAQYWDEEKSMGQIADEVGVQMGVIQHRFGKYGIPVRTFTENKLGEKNPNWRGGASFEPYTSDWNEPFRESVRERDDYRCAICGEWGMCVHHIDYDKANSCTENCITLCRVCHSITNGSRDLWQKRLEALAKSRS